MRRKGEEYHGFIQKSTNASLSFCACAGVMLYGISAGIRSDIGILLNPIVHSSGQSYEDVSFAIAIMQLMFGASQPFFGILSMRRSNRLVLMIGICSYVIGLCMLPFVQSLPAVITSVGFFLGAGAGAISFGIILTSIVSLVGKRNAMIISGILNASSGLGSTFFSPVMQSLLSIGGLPFTSLVLCIPTLILLPITYVLTRADSKRGNTLTKMRKRKRFRSNKFFPRLLLIRHFDYLFVVFLHVDFIWLSLKLIYSPSFVIWYRRTICRLGFWSIWNCHYLWGDGLGDSMQSPA